MRKTLCMICACVGLMGFIGLPMLYAVNAPADMTITVPKGMTATKSPVAFSHKGHAAVECKVCHHKGDTFKKCSSAGCHDSTDPKDKSSDKSFYRTFHNRQSERSCVGCHKKQGKGPIKCTECHPKKAS